MFQPTGFGGLDLGASFTSYLPARAGRLGQTLTSALDVEFDLPVAPYALAMGNGRVQIKGVALKDIAQATNLTRSRIQIYGGMAKGLPLANDNQQGLLVDGTIWPAFGNWIGTEQSLDLIIYAAFSNPDDPTQKPNIVLDWKANQWLGDALQLCLTRAYPTFQTPKIDIRSNLTVPADMSHAVNSLGALNSWLLQKTKAIIADENYQGVYVQQFGTTFTVFDGTGPQTPKQILLQDFIGQPTWIASNMIQIKCAMRGDLFVNDDIRMPTQQVQQSITPQSAPQLRQKSDFEGIFKILRMRHVGSFRQPSANAWCTIIDAAALNTDPVGA